MIGRGTIINVIAIVVGASGGLLLKNGIPERMKHTIMQDRLSRGDAWTIRRPADFSALG